MSVVLKFANEEQYQQFISKVKEDVLKEIEQRPNYFSTGWVSIRDQIEKRLRGEYNRNCGHWHTNQQGLYAVFRLAFQQPAIKDLRGIDDEKLQDFHDELFALIDRYRNENKSKEG